MPGRVLPLAATRAVIPFSSAIVYSDILMCCAAHFQSCVYCEKEKKEGNIIKRGETQEKKKDDGLSDFLYWAP